MVQVSPKFAPNSPAYSPNPQTPGYAPFAVEDASWRPPFTIHNSKINGVRLKDCLHLKADCAASKRTVRLTVER